MESTAFQNESRQVFTLEHLWTEIVSFLKQTLSLPGFEMFSTSVFPFSYEDGVLTLIVPNSFTQEWVKDRCEMALQLHFRDRFELALPILYKIQDLPLTKRTEPSDDLDISVPVSEISSPLKFPEPPATMPVSLTLNPRYTFDCFVVGDSNRFAYATCMAVSEKPGRAYNPLFIYGGVGLGKTHLAQSIVSAVLTQHPHWKIVYVPSEIFTNDLINSLRDKRIPEFRRRYRDGVDMLVMDDVQFIAGKEKTEEEYFHTFEALHSAYKQIVVTSDRPPKELKVLSERLRSRFEWGMVADIQLPELETRMAILRKKAEMDHLNISDEVLDFIATQIPSNVRELEGAMTRIVAYGSLVHKPLTVPFVEDVIKNMVAPHRDKPVTISLIKRTVAEYYNLNIEDLSIKKRTKEVAEARQIAMFLSRTMTTSSLPKIGEDFGGRDHTTVMHACDKIKEMMTADPSFRKTIDTIKHNLHASVV